MEHPVNRTDGQRGMYRLELLEVLPDGHPQNQQDDGNDRAREEKQYGRCE